MALPAGFNFRETASGVFVTDVAPDDWAKAAPASGNYPTTYSHGLNAGWETGASGIGIRDRLAANGPHLAGIHFVQSTGTSVFRVDLPSSGSMKIQMACGDASNSQGVDVTLLDNATSLQHYVRSGGTAIPANSFLDSTGATLTNTAWDAGANARGGEQTQTFSSTIFRLSLINDGSGNFNCPIAHLYIAATAPLISDQEGGRFGNDDGNEAAHTFAAGQDWELTAPLSQNVLMRAIVNGTGDLASAAYTLRYQKNNAGGYAAVPVGATIPEVFGTATFGAIGTTPADGSTSVTPNYPTGITAGQYLIAVVTSGATNSETPTAADGTWSLLATGASTDGTWGAADAGPRRVTVFGKTAVGTESGTSTFNITNGNTCRGSIYRFTKAGSGTWDVSAQGGNDSTSGTGVSATMASMNWNTGDAVLVAVGQRVDTATQSAQSLTAAGVTFGTRTNRQTQAVNTGNDHRHVVDTFAAVSATSNVNAAPTWAYTASAAASAGVVIVRLREYTAPTNNGLYVATSANIAAGGEATTARLDPPNGKTTSDFVTGRRWDDENGSDSIDITVDDYTEVEWCLQAQSPTVVGDYFDFRVYAGSSALDTYAITPRLVIGTLSSSPPLFTVPTMRPPGVRR